MRGAALAGVVVALAVAAALVAATRTDAGEPITVYAAAVHVNASSPDAAKRLLAFLTAPAAVESIKKMGLEPPK